MKSLLGPEWVKNAVFYEIYPQSFYDSNDDGIGDIQGIIEKLDYVASLGVNAIWLNPCYLSPFQDAGYDVQDYYKIAPRYGTNNDIKELFEKAKSKGLRIILDLVPGHTSIEHKWFKESAKQTKNKYSNWYIWTNSVWDDGGEPYNQKMIMAHSDRDGNFLTNYFSCQPALNFGFTEPNKDWQLSIEHPDVQNVWNEFENIMRFWLEMGCDGFRIDMAGSIIRNDPQLKGISRFWGGIRNMLNKDFPEAFIIAEWSCPKNAINAGFHADFHHWFPGHYDLFRGEEKRSGPGGRGSGYSFFDKQSKGTVSRFLEEYLEHYKDTIDKGYIAIPVGNHDLPRINIDRDDADLEQITAFLLSFPGPPFIYYGEEIGMKHLPNVPNREGAYTPRKGARTPMQWNNNNNAGFSTANQKNLYFPVDNDKSYPNVEDAEKNKESLLHKTRLLIKMRTTQKALEADAKLEILYGKENKYPFVFSREKAGERIICAFNPADRIVKATFKIPLFQNYNLLAGYENKFEITNDSITIEMQPCTYTIILNRAGGVPFSCFQSEKKANW